MIYEHFLRNLGFRFIKPDFQFPVSDDFYEKRLKHILTHGKNGIPEKFGMLLEAMNTIIPEGGSKLRRSFLTLKDTPKMSTLAIAALISRSVEAISNHDCFVNVGVWHGFSFLSSLITNPEKTCIGVDNFSEFGGPKDRFLGRFNRLKSANHFFYDMDYQEYFRAIHHDKIGFYFYDGDHQYAHQMQGLRLAEPFLTPNAIILIDDTNREAPRQATLDFVAQSRFRYEILLDQPTCISDHPTFWDGVMVLQRKEK